MTPEEIIAMAKEARISEMGLNIDGSIHLLGLFERFAALVAAKERDACAQVCDRMAKDAALSNRRRCDADALARSIRSRGQKEGV